MYASGVRIIVRQLLYTTTIVRIWTVQIVHILLYALKPVAYLIYRWRYKSIATTLKRLRHSQRQIVREFISVYKFL